MKALHLIFISLFSLTISAENKSVSIQEISNTNEATVLICTGKYSKRYHNSQCRGMKACKGEQQKVVLSDAKKMGLTACGYCYK